MPEPPLPPSDPEAEPADAGLLFQDAPAETSPSRPATPSNSAPTETAYDLEESQEPPQPRPRVPPDPPGTEPSNRSPSGMVSSASVDEVWSRIGEWGGSLALLFVVGLSVAGLVYLTFDLANPGLALGLLLMGGLLMIVLSYPILITLERPVRMTPEQALQDFYGALAHHVPHYRRMWLLLSTAGRTTSDYGSFEGFVRYWKRQLAALRGTKISALTPLVFQIHDFKSEKSAGKTALNASYTLVIYARGRQSGPPLARLRSRTSLVRGPDRMWYLNRGTLPNEADSP